MEDILNMWTKDLEKSTREFHKQAALVAEWDKKLIDNGQKISKLHEEVTQVELLQKEVEENLDFVNAQQEELNMILDTYEKQIKDVFDQSNMQQPLHLVDVQREKAYGLAETLNSQLDDVNRNMTVMIDEINNMSRAQSNEGDDDTASQIVKILNAHLSSLQWIDSTSAVLQNKLQQVNK
ncbi:Nsp1-like C-terminal region-domain-containing protein, partial [Dichotomocladium elegans]